MSNRVELLAPQRKTWWAYINLVPANYPLSQNRPWSKSASTTNTDHQPAAPAIMRYRWCHRWRCFDMHSDIGIFVGNTRRERRQHADGGGTDGADRNLPRLAGN